MGDVDNSWKQLNGLLSNKATSSITRLLDEERWRRAEGRVDELIQCIQPNKESEEKRQAVADYVIKLIGNCIDCQVFIFGSVPLKTYLPDGDIDLTTFGENQNQKDTWATEVRDMLLIEEKNGNAEFRVREVQYIKAEVKIIKCLVENIVVDISFNQLGGLCTLCFLEEVDRLIDQNHLFKRSIILIKAWCYYESRILGAHHGLISTYALETLVLYIFHVFNKSFTGPLEVLYRFLEFFSVFDWENFCISLWGPVPITSLKDKDKNMTAIPPRKDRRKLLLSNSFLESSSTLYAVSPVVKENQGQAFLNKHLNVIDPLRANNNLGRSVSKGNFFRIRGAFAFGAKRLARLLDGPRENLIAEVNLFFKNTWERHGNGRRPDAYNVDLLSFRSLKSVRVHGPENVRSSPSSKKKLDPTNESKIYRTQSQKNYGNLTMSRLSEQDVRNNCSSESMRADHSQRSSRKNLLINEVQVKYQFARTQSSPELRDTSGDVSRSRPNRGQETGKSQMAGARPDYNRRKNLSTEVNGTRVRYSQEDASSRHSSEQGFDAYNNEVMYGISRDEAVLAAKTMEMHQEEQDLVNMMASSRLHGFGSSPMSFPLSPSVLAYAQKHYTGVGAQSFPLMDPRWCSNIQFSQGPHYFPNARLPSNSVESSNKNFDLTELNQDESDNGFWHEEVGSSRSLEHSDSFLRDQDRFERESRALPRENLSELCQYENGRAEDVYSTDRNLNLRHLSASQASSSKSKTSSESSWDGSSKKGSKSSKDRRSRRTASSMKGSDYENREWFPFSSAGTELTPSSVDSPRSDHQLPHEQPQVNVPASMASSTPVVVGSGSRYAFYLTGPPVPFLAMLPIYNIPNEGSSEGPTPQLDRENCLNKLDHNLSSPDSLDKSEIFYNSTLEPSEEHKSDILNGDFTSHIQNLEYGRNCQNSRHRGPMIHPTPVMMPPVYLQGHFPWDGPERPMSSANMNVFPQLVNNPRFLPVPSGSNGPPSAYQRFGDESPRYRGTGTYMPKASFRERQSVNSRNQKGNYSYDRSDHHHIDKEGNLISNSRRKITERSRSQNERTSSRTGGVAGSDSRVQKPFGSYRYER